MTSKAQIDRLGDRLRAGNVSPADLELLDTYRREFRDPYERVLSGIRAETAMEPSGRPAKSTASIIAKLRREKVRLSQIQDIAGCRLVVPNTLVQDEVVSRLTSLFRGASSVDRRQKPTYGYRAVHVIAVVEGSRVEIQVRTALQQKWAEFSEKLFDVVDPVLKYGGGDPVFKRVLQATSIRIADVEESEGVLALADDPQERQLLENHLDVMRRGAMAEIDGMLAKLDAFERRGNTR